MSFRGAIIASLLISATFSTVSASAQIAPASSTLSGVVADPSGAVIPGAVLHVHSAALDRTATADSAGTFNLKLPPDRYDLEVSSPGFAPFRNDHLILAANQHRVLAVHLIIATRTDEIAVPSDSSDTTDPSQNQSAIVLKGDQLAALSDDDATLQQQLIAMAGGDESSPQIYVDGFSGGQFPPKSSIQEVRINQNPYSAQYDQHGYGRIEIFTKPGGGQIHGLIEVNANDNAFNARNPYTGVQPPYHSLYYYGNVSGPLGKKTSFFFYDSSVDQQNNAIVNAIILDPNDMLTPFSQAVSNPFLSNGDSLRIDRQFSAADTFTGSYEFSGSHVKNSGVGLFVLPMEGANSSTQTQTLQLSNTRLIGAKIVSETRFQYIRTRGHQTPDDTSPTLVVQGAFNGGGSPSLITRDNQDRYEFQEYLSIARGKHFLRAGGRYRLFRDANLSTANYNGQFTFPSITAYQITQQGLQNHESDQQIRATCVSTSTGPVCGGASQFSLTAGQPSATALTGDIGLYAEDDWKIRKNITLSLGFRFESQSAIPDHIDPAPHLGFAWAIHPSQKGPAWLTLRGGSAIFYDRFPASSIMQAARQNGTTQQSFFVQNPSFYPSVPLPSGLNSTPPTIYRINPHLHSAYDIEAGLTAEHAFGKVGSVSATFLGDRDVHQFLSENINAPLPGTYNPSDPTSGVRPLGGTQNIYQYSSDGIGSGKALMVNSNLRLLKYVQAFSFYAFQFRNSDVSGISSFPSNPYDIRADYGTATGTARHRAFVGFWSNLPRGFALGGFLSARSGAPFNITTGADLNGDTIYNDRPAFATDLSRPSVIHTALGNFDTSPLPSQTIVPYNYGTSAPFAALELHLGKSFRFGPRPAAPAAATGKPAPKPDPRYSFGFSAEAENVLNRNNPGPPVGVLTSPFFDKPISLSANSSTTSANRTISVRTFFTF